MKGLSTVVFVIFLSLSLYSQEKFELLWQENFDSSQIDYSRWGNSYRWGRNLYMNPEVQYYTDGQNFELGSGMLNIIARHEKIRALADSTLAADKMLGDSGLNLRNFPYSSGMLRTKDRFTYGKFEIRCKLPAGPGTWPAFWLFGDCGEIDIFEKPWQYHYGITNNIHYTAGKTAKEDFRTTELDERNTFSKKFHTYSLEWTPNSLTWLIDDVVVRTQAHQFKCSMELFINLAIANDDFWGYAPRRKKWRGVFAIDYIKVWRLKR